jgi:hypothetical protein
VHDLLERQALRAASTPDHARISEVNTHSQLLDDVLRALELLALE